ncbi:hypothetical protein quinque_012919 [Culex quinquefasciatus]
MRRFTKGKIAARKALYSLKMVRTKMPKVDITAVKKIGSAKNGCEHKMLVKKNNSYLPTKSLVHKRSGNRCFRNHKRNNRNCSRSRKADQKTVDKEVLEAIKVHPEARGIRRYLKTMYSLPSLCAAPV